MHHLSRQQREPESRSSRLRPSLWLKPCRECWKSRSDRLDLAWCLKPRKTKSADVSGRVFFFKSKTESQGTFAQLALCLKRSSSDFGSHRGACRKSLRGKRLSFGSSGRKQFKGSCLGVSRHCFSGKWRKSSVLKKNYTGTCLSSSERVITSSCITSLNKQDRKNMQFTLSSGTALCLGFHSIL